jgi:hypothetical protein
MPDANPGPRSCCLDTGVLGGFQPARMRRELGWPFAAPQRFTRGTGVLRIAAWYAALGLGNLLLGAKPVLHAKCRQGGGPDDRPRAKNRLSALATALALWAERAWPVGWALHQ